jgi:hypothetical protein
MLALLLFTKVKLITFVRLVTAFTKPICSVFKSLSLDLLYNINSCVFDRLFYMKRLVTFKWSMELTISALSLFVASTILLWAESTSFWRLCSQLIDQNLVFLSCWLKMEFWEFWNPYEHSSMTRFD